MAHHQRPRRRHALSAAERREADGLLAMGVQQNQEALVKAAVAGKVTRQGLQTALDARREHEARGARSAHQGGARQAAARARAGVHASTLRCSRSTRAPTATRPAVLPPTVSVQNDALMLQMQGGPLVRLVPTAENVFRVVEVNATLTFNERGGLVESIGLVQGPANLTLARVTANAAARRLQPPLRPRRAADDSAAARANRATPPGPRNWPSFRGDGSAGNGDGQRAVDRMGCRKRQEHQMEDADSRHRHVEPDRLGQPRLRHHGDQQGRRQHASGPACTATSSRSTICRRTSGRSTASTRRPERSCGSARRVSGAPENETPHQEQPGELDAGHRRPARRRRVRVGRPAGRVGLQRQGAVARQSRHARQRMVLRSDIPVGPLELADHLSQLGDPAGRRAEGLVHRGVGSRDRQAAVEDRARRRDLHVGHADDRPHAPTGATSSSPTARRSAATTRPPGKLLWTLGPNSEITIGTPVAGQRARLCHRRLSAGAADLRDPAWRQRRHLAAEGTGVERRDRLEQHDRGHLHPDAAGLRRLSLHAEHQRHPHAPTTRRPASARSAAASASAARSRRHRSAPTAGCTSRARTARCTSISATSGLTQIAKNDMKEVIMATPAISDGLIIMRTLGHLYGIGQ